MQPEAPPWMAAWPPLSDALTAPAANILACLPPKVRRTGPKGRDREVWLKAGAFLHLHAAWEWFFGLSFKYPVTRNRAESLLRAWGNSIASESGGHLIIGWGIEKQLRDVHHFHGLMSFPEGNIVAESRGRTLWRHGKPYIVKYDAFAGGPWYVAKRGEWDVMHGCPRRPACRRGKGCVYKPQSTS